MILALKRLFVALSVIAAVVSVGAIAPTSTAHAASCSGRFLTFPTWYNGLIDNSTCDLKQPGKGGAPDIQGYIMRIVLNVIEILLQVVAYVSVAYIIYGGFKYITSPSDSSKITGARKTIQNAIIGLVISFLSIAIVNLVANNIK